MNSTQISEQNTSKKREAREGRRGNKTSSSGEYMTNFELRKTGGVCVPVGVVPKDRQTTNVSHRGLENTICSTSSTFFPRDAIYERHASPRSCSLPPRDRSAGKSSQVSLTHQALSATLWIAPSEGTSWPHPSFSHTV